MATVTARAQATYFVSLLGFRLGFFVEISVGCLGGILGCVREAGRARARSGLVIARIRGGCSPGLDSVRNLCSSLITLLVARCCLVLVRCSSSVSPCLRLRAATPRLPHPVCLVSPVSLRLPHLVCLVPSALSRLPRHTCRTSPTSA